MQQCASMVSCTCQSKVDLCAIIAEFPMESHDANKCHFASYDVQSNLAKIA